MKRRRNLQGLHTFSKAIETERFDALAPASGGFSSEITDNPVQY